MANENLNNSENPATISNYFKTTLENYGLKFGDSEDFYRYTVRKGMKYMLQVAYFVPELGPVKGETPVVPAYDPRDSEIHFTPAKLHNAVIRDRDLKNDWHKEIKYQIVIYENIKGQHPKAVASKSGSSPDTFESNLKEMIQKLDELAGITT